MSSFDFDLNGFKVQNCCVAFIFCHVLTSGGRPIEKIVVRAPEEKKNLTDASGGI